ncbi:Rpn family recombination-promoting nuclease/putative transposase [Paenibacillus sp. FSL K6-1217]|uniref:Rpn family recombination-promoting nuclease/putative transposase n=1 Tax=Paenibacillus sp. FSL K6-1217 TaxID=2921466 RepID=UPI00325220AA
MNERVLKKAMNTLEFLSQNEEARRQYEARQRYLHDEASMYEAAKAAEAKGWAEGEAKGKADAQKETAHKLLALGIDLSVIAEATGLTIEEIQKLRTIQ